MGLHIPKSYIRYSLVSYIEHTIRGGEYYPPLEMQSVILQTQPTGLKYFYNKLVCSLEDGITPFYLEKILLELYGFSYRKYYKSYTVFLIENIVKITRFFLQIIFLE